MSRLYPSDLSRIPKFQDIRETIHAAIRNKENEADDFRRTRNVFLHKLEHETREFLNLGVAVVHEGWDFEVAQATNMTAVNYFKQIQRDAAKPFVLMEEKSGRVKEYHNGAMYIASCWKLTAPKAPRLKNVIAPLLLVAETNFPDDRQPPVVLEKHDRTWVIWFFDAMGETLREGWLEKCKTDPIFRVCLDTAPANITY